MTATPPPASQVPLQDDMLLGPAAPDLGWVPAPRYLLRRRRILRQLENAQPGELLEIGPGAGMLLQELSARGFSCHALETSTAARDLMQRISQRSGRAIDVRGQGSADWHGHFAWLLAFEVLEHIEDDVSALAQWRDWLAPGGTLVMSVPAHPRLWNAADVWAGHFRRYTREGLIARVREVGLEVEHLECIGFPAGNLTELAQARSIERRLQRGDSEGERQANNDRSGIDRGHVLKWYPAMRSPGGRLALRVAFALQAATSRLPLGNGYLLRARKPG